MIWWLTGQSESGKTTLAKKLAGRYDIILDGDDCREIWPGLKMGYADRWEQNLRVARLAKMLEDQGFAVIVAVICPYKALRREVKEICGCQFMFVEGGRPIDRFHPYEKPENVTFVHRRKNAN